MKLYQAFAMDLNHFLNGARAVRITVPGYMPLSVEEIGISQDGHRLVSLCQYGEQNGDLMRDCDLVFMVTDLPHGIGMPRFRDSYVPPIARIPISAPRSLSKKTARGEGFTRKAWAKRKVRATVLPDPVGPVTTKWPISRR